MNNSHAPFGFKQPEDSPGYLLWQTTITWQRLIKKTLEPYNVSHAQFVIMAALMWFENQQNETTQTDIIKMSQLDKMTISASLKRLTSLKLVKRRKNTKDTRAKTIYLTSAGKTLICTLVPIVESVDAHFFGQLASKQQHLLINILQKLTINKHE